MEGPSMVLKKYQPTCIFCNEEEGLTVFHGKNVCAKCLKELKAETGG